MKEPIIKREPGTGTSGSDNSWKSLPVLQGSKPEGIVKKENRKDIKLSDIPRKSETAGNVPAYLPQFPRVTQLPFQRRYRRPRRHFGPFTGFCYNCGFQGHRQEQCSQNNLVLKIDDKYHLRAEGVVGAINRLGRYPIFRRYTDGRVALSKDEDWMDVEGDAFVVVSHTGVMSEVNVHVFNAAGATIVAFPAAFSGLV